MAFAARPARMGNRSGVAALVVGALLLLGMLAVMTPGLVSW